MRSCLLVAAVCFGWGAAQAQTAEVKAYLARQTELTTKIRGVLTLEDDRARQDRGAHTGSGDNVTFQNCTASEFAKTDRNYTTLVLTLGAYLRLQDPGTPPVRQGRISFDDAETGWQTYRKQICDAVYQTYGSGTGAPGAFVDCEVKVTRSHMHELVTTLGVPNP